MVNLESQNLMQLSDFSVLNDIFHPSTAPSVDPRLVLTSRSPSWVPPSQLSPSKKDPSSSSPAPVPLSVQELERVDTKGAPSSPLRDEKSPPVDIVHLAAEEIRKPLLKLKDEPKVFDAVILCQSGPELYTYKPVCSISFLLLSLFVCSSCLPK